MYQQKENILMNKVLICTSMPIGRMKKVNISINLNIISKRIFKAILSEYAIHPGTQSPSTPMMHGERYSASPDLSRVRSGRQTRSGTEDITTTPKRASITCKPVTMIRKQVVSSALTAMSAPGKGLSETICSRIVIIIR